MTQSDIQQKIKVLSPSNTADRAPIMIVDEAHASFVELTTQLTKQYQSLLLTVKESYISRYHYLLEMRKRLKAGVVDEIRNSNTAVPASLSTLSAAEVPSASAFDEIGTFFKDTLYDYATRKGPGVFPTFFEPPLQIPQFAFISSSNQIRTAIGEDTSLSSIEQKQLIYGIPATFESVDPRRSGRLIIVNESDIIKRTDIQEFILNNGPLYGLVPYSNIGLYYYGLSKLKELTKGKSKVEVLRIITRFLTQTVDYSNISITADQIGKSTFSPVPPPRMIPASGDGVLSYTYPDGRSRCSLVTLGKRKVHMHTGYEPQFANRKQVPEVIVLHHTSGWGDDVEGSIEQVGKCLAATSASAADYNPPAPPQRWIEYGENRQKILPGSGIHWVVDGHGNYGAGIPETISADHANFWNYGSIGIEIGSPGGLDGEPGNLRALGRSYTGPVPGTTNFGIARAPYIQNWQIIDLGFEWENRRYTVEFTDAQIQALEKLILEIFGRYPAIREKIIGKNQWKDVWGLPAKPQPGSTGNVAASLFGSSLETAAAAMKNYGIVIHATGNHNGHHDTVPTPKLVALLNRLGFNEG